MVDLAGRRRAARARRRRLWAAVAGVLAAGVVAAVGATWRVGEVRVTGLRTLAAQDVLRASGVEVGDRMMLVRASSAASDVGRMPAVRTARVRRGLWTSVTIEVRERTAVARVSARLAIDAHGTVFPVPSTHGLPVLETTGTVRAGGRVRGPMRLVLAAYGTFPASLTAEVAAFRTDGTGAQLVLKDGTVVRLGDGDELDAKARAAAAVLDDASRRGVALAYVDVRSARSPVSAERAPATPEPKSRTNPEPKSRTTPEPGTRASREPEARTTPAAGEGGAASPRPRASP